MLTESDGTVKKLLIAAGSVAAAAAVWFVASRRGCGCFSKGGAAAAAKGAGSKRLDAIVISGPSGVGKGTLITRLRTEHPNSFGFSVSHTTRAPRAGESDGKDYHFVSRDVMTAMVANGEFLENCDVHGNMYGTSKAALQKVRDEGRVAIIEMDVQGAQKLKAQQGDLVFHYMFITAPLEALEERITKRGADSPEKTRVRLETARKEFEFLQANPTFFDSVLTNDDLDATYAKLLSTLKAAGVAL